MRIRNAARHARRSQAWPRIVWDDRGWDGNDWLNARVRSAGRAGPVKVGPKAGGWAPAASLEQEVCKQQLPLGINNRLIEYQV